MKKLIAGLGIGAALAFGAPNTSEAQGPIITGGLVNVTLVDVLNNNNIAVLNNVAVGVAANVAAQICGTQVALPANIIGVLVAQVATTGQATACTITDQTGVVRTVQLSKQQQ
jgi:hypothetical protein